MPFLRPISDRYFEDYIEGDMHRFGTVAVEADEIVAFANRFDPQTLHTDPEAAKSGPFGGLIASGWHTHRRPHDAAVHGPLSHQGGEPGLSRRR